jgi:hypothetical protein
VVDDGHGKYSHGKTLAEAKRGLIYKLSSRDTSAYKKWTLNTTVSLVEAISAYRAITGACEQGVRNFCEGLTLPKKLTIGKVIKLVRGQYGFDIFEKFFAETNRKSTRG